jgi:hypothetical protein
MLVMKGGEFLKDIFANDPCLLIETIDLTKLIKRGEIK